VKVSPAVSVTLVGVIDPVQANVTNSICPLLVAKAVVAQDVQVASAPANLVAINGLAEIVFG
jgi:hypothetical protein